MRFALSEEQVELGNAVRGLVDRRAGRVDLRAALESEAGHDELLWKQLCEQVGVAALAIPEEYGGAGFSTFETHLVLEQLGATLTPSPMLGSAVLATQAVLLAGDQEAGKRLLPGLADGSAVGALAWTVASGAWHPDRTELTARRSGTWRVSGTASLVLGRSPDLLLAVAQTNQGLGIFQVDQTYATWTRTPALDPSLQFATVTLDNAEAEPLTLTADSAVATLRQHAATAVTALQVGGATATLQRTVNHLKERHQFGRPLGSFQALKHRVADMLVDIEAGRSASWLAAWSLAHGSNDLARETATAKAWCSQMFSAVAGEMIQLHGGIGITWEHDAHLFFKRAHATAQLFGTAREHRRSLLAMEPAR